MLVQPCLSIFDLNSFVLRRLLLEPQGVADLPIICHDTSDDYHIRMSRPVTGTLSLPDLQDRFNPLDGSSISSHFAQTASEASE